MLIVNQSNVEASWFCYNSNDEAKLIALASGDLAASGGQFAYDPPQNATGRYHVVFTVKGVPPSLGKLAQALGSSVSRDKSFSQALAALVHKIPDVYAGGELAAGGTIVMAGSERPYQATAGDGYAAATDGYQAG